mmetsp:Transcript_6610/g.14635  ORF Transcript_6610/g.14635 Transcript_6610/m.14635 type:complete len:272 (+) Transcript_6610:568-1383(+)
MLEYLPSPSPISKCGSDGGVWKADGANLNIFMVNASATTVDKPQSTKTGRNVFQSSGLSTVLPYGDDDADSTFAPPFLTTLTVDERITTLVWIVFFPFASRITVSTTFLSVLLLFFDTLLPSTTLLISNVTYPIDTTRKHIASISILFVSIASERSNCKHTRLSDLRHRFTQMLKYRHPCNDGTARALASSAEIDESNPTRRVNVDVSDRFTAKSDNVLPQESHFKAYVAPFGGTLQSTTSFPSKSFPNNCIGRDVKLNNSCTRSVARRST